VWNFIVSIFCFDEDDDDEDPSLLLS
jgi:hypothetical protein